MGCYNCTYLDVNNKKDGKTNGCLYYCTKMDKYVNGAFDSCNDYSKDYSRKVYESNEIYNNGRHYYNGSDTPIAIKIIFIIILIIIAIICNT